MSEDSRALLRSWTKNVHDEISSLCADAAITADDFKATLQHGMAALELKFPAMTPSCVQLSGCIWSPRWNGTWTLLFARYGGLRHDSEAKVLELTEFILLTCDRGQRICHQTWRSTKFGPENVIYHGSNFLYVSHSIQVNPEGGDNTET